jgi:hypothetical protein
LWDYRLLPIGQSILTNREIIQCPTENPADFLRCLTEALTHYTKLDPSSKDGIIILNSHFISQSFPDIQRKLKPAEDGPQPPPPGEICENGT